MINLPGMSSKHLAITERLVQICRADGRVSAAFLVGSHSGGTADSHSDLDFILIIADAFYDEFLVGREAFVRLLGEPLFLENFDNPHFVFVIFADGSEVELQFFREAESSESVSAPNVTLVDKKGLGETAVSIRPSVDLEQQNETLRRQIAWFWHDLSHFITALARGQLWWARGQLDQLGHYCVNLARLANDFTDGEAGSDPYFKIEKVVPAEKLAAIEAMFCEMDREAMLNAAWVIVRYYQETAGLLARRHGQSYPEALEKVMLVRLEQLAGA